MPLTIQRKRQIDLLLPTILATVAGVLAFRKKGAEYRILIVAVLGTFIVAYILTTQITKIIASAPPSSVPDMPGAENYDGTPLAKKLYDDIYEIFGFHDFDIYRELADLTDAQLIKVYNAWNKNFYAEDKETLPVAIAGEEFGIWNDNLQRNILNRFSALNLS